MAKPNQFEKKGGDKPDLRLVPTDKHAEVGQKNRASIVGISLTPVRLVASPQGSGQRLQKCSSVIRLSATRQIREEFETKPPKVCL